jgi:hypothetical protein
VIFVFLFSLFGESAIEELTGRLPPLKFGNLSLCCRIIAKNEALWGRQESISTHQSTNIIYRLSETRLKNERFKFKTRVKLTGAACWLFRDSTTPLYNM